MRVNRFHMSAVNVWVVDRQLFSAETRWLAWSLLCMAAGRCLLGTERQLPTCQRIICIAGDEHHWVYAGQLRPKLSSSHRSDSGAFFRQSSSIGVKSKSSEVGGAVVLPLPSSEWRAQSPHQEDTQNRSCNRTIGSTFLGLRRAATPAIWSFFTKT